MTDTEYPRLRYLMSAYFFQDYDDSGGADWQPQVDEFLGSEPATAARELVDEIDRLLRADDSDERIGERLDSWGADVDTTVEGARAWLTAVRDRVAAGL